MKTLIVYFTRTGNTKKIVDALQPKLAADVEKITEKDSRHGILGFIKSGRQGASKADVEIQPIKADPSSYELIVLASPVWAGNVSAPMRAFINKYKDSLPDTAVFLTHDGPDITKAIKDVTETLEKEAVALGEASSKVIKNNEHHKVVQEFLQKIRA